MYAGERANVSAAEGERIPAAIGKRNAVRENSGDHPANPKWKSERRGRACYGLAGPARGVFPHCEEGSAIVNGVAVERYGPLRPGREIRSCTGKPKLLGTRN